MRPYLKNKIKIKGLGGMAVVADHLPYMSEALGSIPGSPKTKKP
jgi:hypothetical protein